MGFSLRPGITRPGHGVDTDRGMDDRSTPNSMRRGPDLLLQHCAALTRIEDVARPHAFHRLERAVGDELARFLVVALGRRTRDRVDLAA